MRQASPPWVRSLRTFVPSGFALKNLSTVDSGASCENPCGFGGCDLWGDRGRVKESLAVRGSV